MVVAEEEELGVVTAEEGSEDMIEEKVADLASFLGILGDFFFFLAHGAQVSNNTNTFAKRTVGAGLHYKSG